jgi:hypothetical protein
MDIIYPLTSDDQTLKDDHPSYQWSVLLNDGFASNGQGMTTALSYREWLTEIGFVDIVEVKEKWPTNGWPRDPKYKQVGKSLSNWWWPTQDKGTAV